MRAFLLPCTMRQTKQTISFAAGSVFDKISQRKKDRVCMSNGLVETNLVNPLFLSL